MRSLDESGTSTPTRRVLTSAKEALAVLDSMTKVDDAVRTAVAEIVTSLAGPISLSTSHDGRLSVSGPSGSIVDPDSTARRVVEALVGEVEIRESADRKGVTVTLELVLPHR